MKVEVIKTPFNDEHTEISTQSVLVSKELLLIHPYIPPRVSREERKKFWSDIHAFIDSWTLRNPSCKIIITGDLNTRDSRFGIAHNEHHRYLDPILASLDIISERNTATRERNMLDVTLGNITARNSIIQWKIIEKLNSDHSPTNTKIKLISPPYERGNHEPYKNKMTYTVMDLKTTRKRIQTAIRDLNASTVDLVQINDILSRGAVYKTTHHKPIKFWTAKLRRAVQQQNKARKAIRTALEHNRDTIEPYRIYKRLANKFSKLFKKTKKQYKMKLIEKACQDPTGAGFFKIIKQIEPQVNKKLPENSTGKLKNENEAETIALKFEEIFGQEDVTPNKSEKQQLKEDLNNIKCEIQFERCHTFTIRELDQEVTRANIRSAKGPDGVSNRLIKLACENNEFKQVLLQAINNQILIYGTYPTSLKIAKIVPLPKQKPGD